jgi:hypothetical protein
MEAKFSSEVCGWVNSAINPLFYSLVLLNNLIEENSGNFEEYNRLLLIDQQVQRAIEIILELRSSSMIHYGNDLSKTPDICTITAVRG